MLVFYSVGLYCKYEGGTPFIYFEKREDAEFLVSFLERYSLCIDKLKETDEVLEVMSLSDEFFQHHNITNKTLPYKTIGGLESYLIKEHTLHSLTTASQTTLNKIVKYED